MNEEKKQKALSVFENDMTDKEFDEYLLDFIDTEEMVERIGEYLTGDMIDEEELDAFISKYKK